MRTVSNLNEIELRNIIRSEVKELLRFDTKSKDNIMTPKEIREKYKISIPTLYRWIREGRVKKLDTPGIVLISENEFRKNLGILQQG